MCDYVNDSPKRVDQARRFHGVRLVLTDEPVAHGRPILACVPNWSSHVPGRGVDNTSCEHLKSQLLETKDTVNSERPSSVETPASREVHQLVKCIVGKNRAF